ncbi:ATP-binding cassette transporter SNQ2 [Sugiyamaella lignohabitans]|uniref:ATP-binding cassette transporter SNQ2 n=1 Tax=Sugiyamaella lignohabitans TaxID=796027 RepID=A0A161HNX7_9ASCO|nr:ATP-binding cassette transporter SNQ2 [Sugiyamaella lignohabitans]ANB15927.1 ATP-binding cassette transporter SNQ2 [Sugiyamaella lignohabitans]
MDSKVGNQFVPGTSPLMRHKLTVAEAAACRGSVYCWDETPKSVDFTIAIRALTNLISNVSISAAHQANQRVYDLYDKVLILFDGHEIFFGRSDAAHTYFERLGYAPSATETTDDFLARIASRDVNCQHRPVQESKELETHENPLMRPQELERAWKSSPEYAKLIEEIDQHRAKHTSDAKFTGPLYSRSYLHQLRLGAKRGYQRILGDKMFQITQFLLGIFNALVLGPLFFNLNPTTVDAFSKGGGLFFALVYNITIALIEVAVIMNNRPILLKQRRYYFIRPSVENFHRVITDLPFRSIGVFLFALPYYFLSSFRLAAGHFFLYLFVVELTTYAFVSYYQMMASIIRVPEVGSVVVVLSVIFFLSYSGYMIPTTFMHPWFRWLNRIDPMAYGFEILLLNEFHGRNMTCGLVAPSGPGYENLGPPYQSCVMAGVLPNQVFAVGDSYMANIFAYTWSHVWRNVGIIIALWLSFLLIGALGSELFAHAPRGSQKHILFKNPDRQDQKSLDDLPSSGAINRSSNIFEKRDTSYTWQHISKEGLLDDVSGFVQSGQMTAIISENLMSLTALTELLALRSPTSDSGNIRLNGSDPRLSNCIGFVQADDDHISYQTVREALQFSARLRLPSTMPDSKKMQIVDRVIADLDMYDMADALVGKEGGTNSLPAYHRKKLAIGVEMVALPDVLIVDLPTNRLDTVESHKFAILLTSLARDSGVAIISSLWDPSSSQLDYFDNVLLLDPSGGCSYFGKVGQDLREILRYFNRSSCDPYRGENLAGTTDFLLQTVRNMDSCGAHEMRSAWSTSREKAVMDATIVELNDSRHATPMIPHNSPNSYMRNFGLVFKRTARAYWRTPRYFFFKAFSFALIGLFVGFTFYKAGNTAGGLQNGVFAFFFSIVVDPAMAAMIHDQVMPIRDHYERGEKNYRQTYHWSCLTFSVLICEVAVHIPLSTLTFLGLYYPTHYTSQPGYFYFVYCILFQLYVVSISLGITFMSPDIMSANNLSSTAFNLTVNYCGVPQRPNLMTGLYRFLYRVSPLSYFVQAYSIAFFHELPVVCKPQEYTVFSTIAGKTCQEYAGPFIAANGGYLANPDSTSTCQYCQFAVGDEFMHANLSTGIGDKWRNVGIIFAYILFNIAGAQLCYFIFRVVKWPSFLKKISFIGRQFVFAKKIHDD